MAAPYDAVMIANWFVGRARQDEKVLSIMTVLKLCYIAHGWHLEIMGAPLFWNRIEAWRYGPVIRDVYIAFRPQGVKVSNPVAVQGKGIDSQGEEFLEEVYSVYGDVPALKLSKLTHVRGGPWDIVTEARGYYAHIPDILIKRHYAEKRAIMKEQADHAR